MLLSLSRRKIVTTLIACAAVLVLIHSVVLAIYFYVGDEDVFDFVRLVDLDYEGNLPTLFSVLLFELNSVLLYLVYRFARDQNQTNGAYWLGLAIIFLYLGIDEGSRLHEELGDFTENFIDAEGFLYFPWVVPYAIAMLVATAVYFKFFLSLERPLQIRLFLCAVLFLSGAVGIEMFSAREADISGTSSLAYSVLYTIEESLEMAGLILFIDTLLLKLKDFSEKITIQIG